MKLSLLLFLISHTSIIYVSKAKLSNTAAKFLRRETFKPDHVRARPVMRSELLSREKLESMGVKWRHNSSRSHEMLEKIDTPMEFSWCNKSGRNYCTTSRNQHIPQYCGSCWIFGALSALEDRIKIARKGKGPDIQLAPQHVLNCGSSYGTCHGGGLDSTYQWIYEISQTGTGISYESSQSYVACSWDSDEGFCRHVDTSCKPENVARTCGSQTEEGGLCRGLGYYPNATIRDYGSISGAAAIKQEILQRGPVMCGIEGTPLLAYESGVIQDSDEWSEERGLINHVVTVTGWGVDPVDGSYWEIRNSWGEYWGEMGYGKIKSGHLSLERVCNWASPGVFTAFEHNNQPAHCHEGGDNCGPLDSSTKIRRVAPFSG